MSKYNEGSFQFFNNTDLNDLRKIFFSSLRKSLVTMERISVGNDIEKCMEHGIHCLRHFYTNDVIDLLL